MHNCIFEINDTPLGRDDWANESTISDGEYEETIDGVDYYNAFEKPEERCEAIKDFFTDCFPDKSFRIIKNKPDKTATVEFIGDIRKLFQKWMDEIKAKTDALTIDEMSKLAVFNVRRACVRPFGISDKFYQEEWNGCTVDADDFLSMLYDLAKENDFKPFRIYVGQVFDAHI